jgi:ABC-type Zn uptake system ZnuABC Zn-binding protein ZnuA
VPVDQRKLITTHDSFGYFARRYDIEVVGALIPSLSTQAQPSAKDVQALVEQIRAEDVNAIFPESSLNPRLERAVAREAGAEVGGALWADALGPEGSDGATYVDAMAADVATLVEGFSGGEVSCTPDTRRAG